MPSRGLLPVLDQRSPTLFSPNRKQFKLPSLLSRTDLTEEPQPEPIGRAFRIGGLEEKKYGTRSTNLKALLQKDPTYLPLTDQPRALLLGSNMM